MSVRPSPPEAPAREYDALADAKRLLRSIRGGCLATLDPSGAPLASLAAVATMPDGTPILLLSRLAAHTRHLEGDGRCSLLLAQTGKGNPLAHPRLTLVGHAVQAADDQRAAARARFLARNPKSQLYADFPDFNFWLLHVEVAHLNGGFGKAASFERPALLTAIEGCHALVEAEPGAVAHMNADHSDAVALFATTLLRMAEGTWRLSGLDPEGADLVCGDMTARLAFPEKVTSPGELRHVLVALAADARRGAGREPGRT